MGAAKELLGVVTGQTDRVFDAQQSAIYRANFKLFRGVVYSAVMEKRTCVVCAGYDGTIYWMEKVPKGEKGETFAKKPALPIHPHCRCTYVPFCKSWEELPIDDNEFSKSARKLLGGDIPKTRKWEEWFLTRSENVQRKILGKTRFDLWKANAVDIKDLSVGSKVVPLKDLIEAPKVAKKLAEAKKGLIPQEHAKPRAVGSASLEPASIKSDFEAFSKTPLMDDLSSAAEKAGYVKDVAANGADEVLGALNKMQGYDAVPSLVSEAELARAQAAGSRVLYRGVSGADIAGSAAERNLLALKRVNQFKGGDLYTGTGVFGNGTYTAYGANGFTEARAFAGADKAVMKMALKENAKIVKYEELRKVQEEARKIVKGLRREAFRLENDALLARSQVLSSCIEETGRFATVLGYDAIDVVAREYMVVLNRGALIVVK